MDPRSEVLLRQAELFQGSVLLAGLPADDLLGRLPDAHAGLPADLDAGLAGTRAGQLNAPGGVLKRAGPAVRTGDEDARGRQAGPGGFENLGVVGSSESLEGADIFGEGTAGLPHPVEELEGERPVGRAPPFAHRVPLCGLQAGVHGPAPTSRCP